MRKNLWSNIYGKSRKLQQQQACQLPVRYRSEVQHLAEFGANVKGAYDTAKTIYSLAQVAAPYVMPLLGVI